jgi:hypothetical protein
VENPFLHAVEKSVKASGNVIDGVLNYDNILEMEDLLTDEDYDVNAFISTKKNRSTLRNTHRIENGVIVESLYDRSANTLDGQPVADLKALDKGTIYAGDFDYMYYGIPYGMSYKISEEAQLSTLTNEDGTPVNLYEQELVALRVTMDVGFMIVKDEAFAKLTSGGLGKLTVTSTAGTKAGDTKIAVTPALTSGNSYKYKVGDEMDVPVKGQNVKGWKTWDGAADITPGEGSEIVVAECDASYRVVNAGKTDVTVKE